MKTIRLLDQTLLHHIKTHREIIILLGARQVGKTTILNRLFPDAHYLTLDNEIVRRNFERYDISTYRQFLPLNSKIIIIDEIHLLSDPGRAAKIIYDQLPHIKLIITGSSSLKIKNKSSESLAGRKIDYHLYPLTLNEYLYQKGISDEIKSDCILTNILKKNLIEKTKIYSFDLSGILENILLYGLYPATINHPNDRLYLKNLVDSVIFKDLLDLNLIENRPAALALLRLLAFQIGSLVNYSELATKLMINVKTIKRYLTIFEQSFIIFPLYPYAKAKRDEIGKMPKIYFYDVGLRNALIDNFYPLNERNDSGALFENFIISEVYKENYYSSLNLKLNYWRTKQGSEVDLIIENRDRLYGVEIKTTSVKINRAFLNHYPSAALVSINKNNFY